MSSGEEGGIFSEWWLYKRVISEYGMNEVVIVGINTG